MGAALSDSSVNMQWPAYWHMWLFSLQFHVSGASRPRLASSASAGNSGCSLRGHASSLTTSLRPCIGSCCSCSAWDVGSLVVTMSSNQVGRTDLTPIALAEFVFLMLSLRRLWYMGGIIHAGTNTVMNWTFHATCRSLGLKSGVMHPVHLQFVCMTPNGRRMQWLWDQDITL